MTYTLPSGLVVCAGSGGAISMRHVTSRREVSVARSAVWCWPRIMNSGVMVCNTRALTLLGSPQALPLAIQNEVNRIFMVRRWWPDSLAKSSSTSGRKRCSR
jgi:hypothetical protein